MIRLFLLVGLAAQGNGFLSYMFQFSHRGNCSENQFNCVNNHCIPTDKRCDGVNDCTDMSDEEDCDYILCKGDNLFKCKNGRCISKSFICDNENDCEDYSDEENCTNYKFLVNSTCEDNEWRCSDKLCILKEWVCNGEADCLDGSDETIGCTMSIPCDGFKCKNNHCVPTEWICDGSNDCIDNSDEENCENYIDPKLCTWDNKKFLCSDNHTCIDIHLVCDGNPQCPDKSDESLLCSSPASSCANHNCSHTCIQLPTGPKCYCPEGYHNIDEKECQDINECEKYGICDQKCKNSPGSYECFCDHKYILHEDKKTCKAMGGEAMMIFSSKTQIRAYFMQNKLYFPIATQLKQVVGVAYDGTHVYWTDIFSENESIVKSLEDGSDRELLITSGLGSPEDLAVDVITGNIYFTDAEYRHIGVCTLDGSHCTVLLNKDIRKPRGIVLNSEEGEMFWTDWGHPAEIAKAKMDGTSDHPFVSEDIYWPNGLTIDYPNERLYWTDAKVMTIESIKLDGTDRRVVLKGVVKHPYSIAVFENRLFWSDWNTHTIQSCDKFTGKNHQTIIKEKKEFIYGLTVYHSALQGNRINHCSLAFCSDICLLSGSTYSCACPQNKVLSSDQHTCKEIEKRQILVLGAKNMLFHVEHQLLGRHTISTLPLLVKDIGALAYNPIDNSLYISDLEIRKIIKLRLSTDGSQPLDISNLGRVTSMDFDYNGNNLYWGDEEKGTIEALNVKNMARRTILHDLHDEIPESIALVPDTGIMFVAFKKKSDHVSHLDRFLMDGTGRTHIMDQGMIGPIDLYYDRDIHRLFFADAGTGNIETTSVDGDDRHQFAFLNTNPVSLAALKTDLFWINEHSKKLHWSNKYNASQSRRINLDNIPDNLNRMHLISISPLSSNFIHGGCSENNGNCSHLCIPSQKSIICACPNNMILASDNQKCIEKLYCEPSEYKCPKSNKCISQIERCNGIPDCTFGEDEDGCKKENHCPIDYFMCDDGECIDEHKFCNLIFDCKDRSDEHKCSYKKEIANCPPRHFKCPDDSCIADKFVCDGKPDCSDKSDEQDCGSMTCTSGQFRCDSGECIPKSWECDHENDCSDMSDEHPNCLSTCDPKLFTCNNGKCLDQLFVCDTADDCGDNSDELSCEDISRARCRQNEFQCNTNSSFCIPMSAVCNGTSECPDQEDEKKCSKCNVDEFMCLNKKCISRLWTCDGTDDCGDGSDEKPEACRKVVAETRLETTCTGYRCKSGHCIDQSLVCNGQHDCYDNSDENGMCEASCERDNNPCSHICLKTPSGPTCRCRDGYELKGDGKTCLDIDECKREPPICSQLCFNHPGRYLCDCYNGFELRSDKTSCKAEGKPMDMLFTSNNQIRLLSQTENALKLIYSEETAKITGIAHSVDTKDVYVAMENTGTLLKINEKTNSKDLIDHVGQPKTLALDWITNNLYFFNSIPYSRSIDVCNFENKACATLIKTDMQSQVSNLVVDAVNRVIFYTVTSWFIFNSPRYVIYKAYLDGTGKQVVIGDSAGHVSGISCDIDKKQLYYVDQHIGVLNRVNYDGTMKHTVMQNITNPMGLQFFENHIYYLSSSGLMHKCKLFGSNADESFKLDTFNGGLFTIAQKSLQPKGLDFCANHTCSYLCLPSKTHFKCLCEDGRVINENEVCQTRTRSSADEGSRDRMRTGSLKDESSGTSNSFLLSLILIIFLISVTTFGVYYVKRKRYTGGMNMGISFHNATYGLGKDGIEKLTLYTPGRHEYTNTIDFDPTELQTTADTVLEKVKPLVEI
ncbi:hypothetical protein HHI36_001469 [Cryptolaemus montrouzieri]|uniref:EGF-like domain-containing protein n=1 Tax=Cryptolaemus montrouzieri TaxID=559131 RepID=A0ABD2P7Q0_9CUCU